MTAPATRSLVVVTAGLSEPSSSRLLADRLAAAVRNVMYRVTFSTESWVWYG